MQKYLESTGKLQSIMFGFRPHLSTHDVLLQLIEEIVMKANSHTPKAVLAVDVKGAFDVTHHDILDNLNGLDCGNRAYYYVQDFLSRREAVIKIGYISSYPIDLGGRCAPQGALLSPLLFNITLIGLPAKLGVIPDPNHGFYADNITVWIGKGWMGETQDCLQLAADVAINTRRAAASLAKRKT